MPVESFTIDAPVNTGAFTEITLPGLIKQFTIVVDGAVAARVSFGSKPMNTGLPSIASGAALELLDVMENKFRLLSVGAATSVRIWAVW